MPVSAEDLRQAVDQVGEFDADNRSGIDKTLHRISAIRNRSGRVVGLTCRAGRVIEGSAAMVEALVKRGRNILLLGRPGVGKTTAIRDISSMLANTMAKRTVIVDTSNEIGGDGDVPHPGIGDARRMQVPCPEEQHRVMQEAVENHMPQAIVIDEIGTEEECLAARTIAQRGVQLIATAHGNALENVIKNPALNLLVGGIQSVTLGDEAAKRRGVQKSVLERAAPPTFDVCVEMVERHRWRVHEDVGAAVDAILAGREASAQMRDRDPVTGEIRDITFKGVIRKADSTGAMQSLEWYQASDGEDMIRPVAGGTGGGTTVAAERATGQWDQWGVSEADIAHRNNGSGDGGYNGSGGVKASSEILGRGGPAIRAPASLSTSNPPPPSRFTREDADAMTRRPLPKMLVVPADPPPAASHPQPGAAAAPAGDIRHPGVVESSSISDTVAEVIAGVRPLPGPGTDEDEAWRLGWTNKKPVIRAGGGGSASNLKKPAAATPTGPLNPLSVAGEEAGPSSSSAAPIWPRPTVAAVLQPAVLPAPVFGHPPSAAASSASSPAAVSAEEAATPVAAAKAGVSTVSRKPGGAAIRVYLFMDDELATKVQQVLGALDGSASVVMTQDLTAAEVVVATTSKLRSSPKMKSIVRKLGVPIYTIRSTSTSSIYRDLCPLLGLDPLTSVRPSAEALKAAAVIVGGSAVASGSYDSSGSGDDDGAMPEDPRASAPLGGQGRASLTSADDYADLMEQTVRELRYAPIDREYSAHILSSFLNELDSSMASIDGLNRQAHLYGCSAASLATMAWALSHTKHKRKFVEARREALLRLAVECEGRWSEFSSRDLMRLAIGLSNLRLAPSASWVEEVTVRAGIIDGEFSAEQCERLSAALYNIEALLEVSEQKAAADNP